MNGYFVTNVSQVKKVNYFEMRLISKTDTKRVFFSVDRPEEFYAYQVQESLVKIKKIYSQEKVLQWWHPAE